MFRYHTDKAGIKYMHLDGMWCVLSYYTINPYAPDDSGRLLFAGADLKNKKSYIIIASSNGKIIDKFGEDEIDSNFYHTGRWQSWSHDAKYVYYQGGNMQNPEICRYDTINRTEIRMNGDMEGIPPFDEPIISGYLGMLYAAGYADGNYHPELSPIKFEERDKHGLFRFDITTGKKELFLSTEEILKKHPDREYLIELEKKYIEDTGNMEGFTWMTYCVRWNTSGDKCLFYFGNHCVDTKRKEPHLCYIFTADREMKNIWLALDLSFSKTGVHWSWHPDNEHLIGTVSDPEGDDMHKRCICTVKYDGTELKKICSHSGGGHASISPVDYNLLVTDESSNPGKVMFYDIREDKVVKEYILPRVNGEKEPVGRNPFRVCFHPVFTKDGKTILVNTIPEQHAVLCSLEVPKLKE